MAPTFDIEVTRSIKHNVSIIADDAENARMLAESQAMQLFGPDAVYTGKVVKSDRKLAKVKIIQDGDCSDPWDADGVWTLYSFHRHGNGASKRGLTNDPEHFFDMDESRKSKHPVWNEDYKDLAEQGFAHILSCYDHGSQHWGLKGEVHQCQWDTAQVAGVMVWENKPEDMGAKTKEERAEDARRSLEERQKWLDGDCYGYVIEDVDTGEDIDSCWGFVGLDYVREEVERQLAYYKLTPVDDNEEPIKVKDIDPSYR